MAGRRYLLTIIIIAGWLVLLTSSTTAHSNLVRSDPPENAQLTTAPKQVQLWFSEAPELKLSDVQVVTPQRKRIDAGDLHLAPGDPASLIISLHDTPVGTYAVIWQVTSAVDGHTSKGVFAFSYGDQPPGVTAAVLESLAVSSPPITLRPDDAVVRWINLAGMSLFTGVLAFYTLILAPLFKRSDGDAAPYLPLVRNRSRRLALIGTGLMLAGTLLSLLMQAFEISGASLLDAGALLDPISRILTATRYGVIWFIRMGLILLALGLVWRLPVPYPRSVPVRSQQALGFQAPLPAWVVAPESTWWLGMLFGLLILLTTSLNSHAAATATLQPFSTVADWVHLICAALWIGGLAQMGLTLPALIKRTAPEKRMYRLAQITGYFSQLGIVCVTGLIITGIYAAWLEVGTLAGLWTTLYGQTLIVKLLIIVPLLALAAINLLLLRPTMNRLAASILKDRNTEPAKPSTFNFQLSTFNHFKLMVRGESLLVLLVLLAVGFMTGLPPSRDVAAGKTQYVSLPLLNGANTLAGKTDDYSVELNITPGGTGANDFSLSVTGMNNNVPTNIEKAVMRFTYQGSDTGTQEVELAQDSPGSYHAQGSYLSLDGEWWLDVLVRPNGGDYEQVRFDLKVAPGSIIPVVVVKPALQIGPYPAKSGIPEQLRLTLQDDKGAPVTDATVTLQEVMPSHGHTLGTILRHSGGGVYVGSNIFPMSGQWLIIAKIIRSDGSGFERQWSLDVQN